MRASEILPTTAVRLLTWNIRHGGGARVPAILAALAEAAADVLVLTEYRTGVAGSRLVAGLEALDYHCVASPDLAPRQNAVLVAARIPVVLHGPLCPLVPEPFRMLDVSAGPLRIVGAYLPNLVRKRPYWERLLAEAPARLGLPALFAGDFNTTRHYVDEAGALCTEADCMERLQALGYCDAWRELHPLGREYSWYSHRGNGFRIDHVFLSAALCSGLRSAVYLHALRESRLSDHAPLMVELGSSPE